MIAVRKGASCRDSREAKDSGGFMERVKMKRRTPELTPRLALFGPPLLIEGEDAATYDDLLAHMLAAVKPVDVIDEMLIVDVASLEWEVLRWRRLKSSLIRARGLKVLESFLSENLDYDVYSDQFADSLTEILLENLPEDQADDFAQTLAHECARNEPDAVRKVNKILDGAGLYMDRVLDKAKLRKAEELVQEYVRREPGAVTLVDELLTAAGTSIDTLLAEALYLDDIERIDRLAAVAEGRRNASLREIDRRRVVLAETLRRTVQEVEEAEFEVIEATPAKGQKRLEGHKRQ
jgi:hypothetical protein